MPCLRPLKAYRSQESGSITFSKREGWSDRFFDLPCGQCIECRIARSREWAMRCVHEAQLHEANSYVTLTYDPVHLPRDMSLDVSHFQKFVRRLRKRGHKFRYFHCGEYGEENKRPHYHAILFGLDFPDKIKWQKNASGQWVYMSRYLTEMWQKGFTTVGDVTFQSAAYVARYMMKKATVPGSSDPEVRKQQEARFDERYLRFDQVTGEVLGYVKPEYVTMSRRPGIGSEWIKRYKDDVYPYDEVVIEGRKFRPPRYYDDMLEEEELSDLKLKRRKAIEGKEPTLRRLGEMEKYREKSLERLKRRI